MTDHRIPGVQRFDIQSEGPILPWLRLIVADGKVSHFAETTESMGGNGIDSRTLAVARLVLYWTRAGTSLLGTVPQQLSHNQGTRWVGPSVEALASSIDAWLRSATFPDEPDTDGSAHKGWRLTNTDTGYGYAEFAVDPHWTVYGK